ncbi:MAG TPA: hypothetical protein VHS74_10100 [Solirubrobacterales bacterium]|jgi:hypothetical protein|nr:hypothetical protein [Solirubrobacterales bacterium]
MPETEQQIGMDGVKRVRRLLDGTMRFRLPYDVYGSPERVVLPLLPEGERKHFDLAGDLLDEDGRPSSPIYVESKNVKGAGDQATKFKDFLAHAYSATLRKTQDLGIDPKLEFMWATTCPWKGDGFREVAAETALREAIENADDNVIPSAHEPDETILRSLTDRLWVWVISERHEDMVLGSQLRGWIAQRLEETA